MWTPCRPTSARAPRSLTGAGLIDINGSTVLDEIIGTFRAGLDALPARITRDVEMRKTIRAEAEAMLRAASDKFTALAGNPTTKTDTMKESDDDWR